MSGLFNARHESEVSRVRALNLAAEVRCIFFVHSPGEQQLFGEVSHVVEMRTESVENGGIHQ
jgi:hypothetical protein